MSNGSKGRLIGYWLLTGLVVLTQGVSGVMDLVGAAPVLDGVTALGYPAYILWILGPAKLAGIAVLALPGLQRLKEWAYAGFVIDFGGAVLSHLLAGEGIASALPAGIALVVVIGSYALRPASRKLAS